MPEIAGTINVRLDGCSGAFADAPFGAQKSTNYRQRSLSWLPSRLREKARQAIPIELPISRTIFVPAIFTRPALCALLIRFVLLLLLLVPGVITPLAHAAPRVIALFPTGAQRGQKVTVTIQGEELKELSGFYSSGAGLTVQLQPGGDDKTRTAEVTIAPDAALGNHEIRFTDNNGLSNPRYFAVGQWPEIAETEPNDTLAQAQRVMLPVTINGRIAENPDRDSYTFAAKAGETIVCEVTGLRVMGQMGDSWLKGYLEIADKNGQVLASSQGTSDYYYRWDPLIVFTPKTDGDYTATFRDLNWRGDVRAVYRLTLGHTPQATAIFPLGGQRSTTVPVTFIGPYCDEKPVSIPVSADAPNEMPLSQNTATGTTNARPFQVGDLPEILSSAENRTRETAQAVAFPVVVNGQLRDASQQFFRFHLSEKQKVVLEVFSRRLGTPMDPEMLLYDASGNLMQTDDDGRGADCWILRDLDPGDYTVMVRDLQDRSGLEFGYRLSLAPARPALLLTVTPDAVSVARSGGGDVTLTVKAVRDYGWDEEVSVTLENPPPGMTAAPITIPKGQAETKLVVKVAENAMLGITAFSVVGSAKLGDQKITATARAQETYNIQGTAFLRDVTGPLIFVTEPKK